MSAVATGSGQEPPYALQKNGLDPNKDVSILQTGGQPKGLAAMASGKIFVQRMSFPLHLKAFEMGMRELVDFSQLGHEENNGTVITTRSFIAQRRGTVIRFMRAFIRGMYRYKSDREFAKKALAKFAQLDAKKWSRQLGKSMPRTCKKFRDRHCRAFRR